MIVCRRGSNDMLFDNNDLIKGVCRVNELVNKSNSQRTVSVGMMQNMGMEGGGTCLKTF